MAAILFKKNESGEVEQVRVDAQKVAGLLLQGYKASAADFVEAVVKKTRKKRAKKEQ